MWRFVLETRIAAQGASAAQRLVTWQPSCHTHACSAGWMTRHAGADLAVMRLLRLAVLGESNQVESTHTTTLGQAVDACTHLVGCSIDEKKKKRAVCVFFTILYRFALMDYRRGLRYIRGVSDGPPDVGVRRMIDSLPRNSGPVTGSLDRVPVDSTEILY
jgi:hypothetical protein